MALELSQTFLAWCFILPAAFLIGSSLRALVPVDNPVMRGVFYYACGFACLSYGVVLLSALGLLSPVPIWVSLISLCALLHRGLPEWVSWLRSTLRVFSPGPGRLWWVLRTLFLISFLAVLAGTLSPEIGGDALTYQINLPKIFLRNGSLAPLADDYNSYFPLLMNNLYLIGLATGGVFAAKLFHFFCGFLLFLSLYELVATLTGDALLSFFMAFSLWVTPTVYNLISTTYNDVGLALYAFLALAAFVQGIERRQQSLLFLSGLFIGAATAVKYLGLVPGLALLPLWGWNTLARKAPLAWNIRALAMWAAGLAVGCGYWLIRNHVLTGNPFFPYYGSWFGLQNRPPTDHHLIGLGRSLADFLLIFWNMFRDPKAFGAYSTRTGIFYVLFLPLSLAGALLAPKSRPYALAALAFLVGWFFLVQVDRWIIPVLPAVTLTAALGFQAVTDRVKRKWKKILKTSAGAVALFAIALHVAAGVYHYRYAYLLMLGRWSTSEYLRKMERTIPIATWVNTHLASDAKILIEAEPRKFYFDRDTISDVFVRWRTHYDETHRDAASLAEFLKSWRISHVLTSEAVSTEPAQPKKTPLRDLVASNSAELLHTERSENIRDPQYVYRLYELK